MKDEHLFRDPEKESTFSTKKCIIITFGVVLIVAIVCATILFVSGKEGVDIEPKTSKPIKEEVAPPVVVPYPTTFNGLASYYYYNPYMSNFYSKSLT